MGFYNFLISCSIYGLIFVVNFVSTNDRGLKFCDTPNEEPGECIPLINCKPLFQLLKKRPVNPTDILYLQHSTCDENESQPKVCCPKASSGENEGSRTTPKPKATTVPTIKQSTIATQRPAPNANELLEQDVTAHRNVNILPNVTDCGRSVLTDKITGGDDAGLGSYPWMVLLGFSAADDEPIQYACGGTLISSKYVLTAAHCVANLPFGYKLKSVRLGEYNQTASIDCANSVSGRTLCAPPVQDMEIEAVIAHENYDKLKSRENDIALIRLKKHAALGPYVRPVCIPQGEKLQKVSRENKVFVAGWGRLAYDSPENAPVLQVVPLRLVSMDECNRFYAHKDNIGEQLDDGRFCAVGDEGMDSCKGDSGGPLMMPLKPKSVGGAIRIFQLGVVSLGPSRCGHAGQPALYTKVSFFLKWIFDNIKH